ncbi:uncharacterized protein LOC124151612 isoform X2 [Haliotis rufescens]|uniref:uncharacterized protein LOC124151612 isoform X2 n=1 Tax=Haliotis rufescens TaxID=6454 RepID=UPI00201F53A7|nr:uncharacterized protein LOC124151612 isoform X2 [Haliotis rufescens]
MKWTTAIRMFALLCITQTTTAFLSQHDRCTFVDIITCWFNPCRSSVCPLYPQATCSLVYMRCGCRPVWHTSFGQVNCNGPQLPVTSAILPVQAVGRPATPVLQTAIVPDQRQQLQNAIVPDQRQQLQNECPPEVMRVQCRDDPCMRSTCRGMPDAVCRPNYCGGCMAEFFRDGMRVQCGRTSYPELIVPSSVMVKDRSAYTNSKGRQPPPIIQTNPATQVTSIAPGWTGPQVLQPTPSIPQPQSPWTDGSRNTQIPPRVVASGVSSVAQRNPQPNAALAIQQNVMGLGALFPDQNADPQGSSALLPNGPLPTSSMTSRQNNFGSQGQTGNSVPTAPTMTRPTTAGTSWPASQSQGQGQGQNNLAAWRARSGATDTTFVPPRNTVGMGVSVQATAQACPVGTAPSMCSSHPCANQTCGIPGAVCRPNPCGSCFARWYRDGQEVDCTGECPASQITVACTRNPCAQYSCPAHPDAVCRFSKCGSCKAQWFIGDREVACDIPWSTSPCPANEQPTCRCFYNRCESDRQALCRVTGCGSDCGTEFYKVANNSIVLVDCALQKGQWSRNAQ